MEREQILVHATTTQELWQGPLPSPQTMEEYRAIAPDWPERIVQQWEEESAHRRDYEMYALRSTARRDLIGQIFAGIFAISALGVSAYAVSEHQPWVAGAIGGVTLASVVGAFLYQQTKKSA